MTLRQYILACQDSENFSKATTQEISEHLAKMGEQLDTRFQMISHELQMTRLELDNIKSISREPRAAIKTLIKEQDLLFSETFLTLELYHQRNVQLRTWIQGLLHLEQGYLPTELIHTGVLQLALQTYKTTYNGQTQELTFYTRKF